MELGVRMYRHVALVEMREDRVAEDGRLDGLFAARLHRLLFRNQHCHARALRVVVLLRDVEDARADHLRNRRQDLRQALRVVLLVDVLDVVLLLPLRLRITDIIDVEAQCLRQVIEAVQLQLFLQSTKTCLSFYGFHQKGHGSRSRGLSAIVSFIVADSTR